MTINLPCSLLEKPCEYHKIKCYNGTAGTASYCKKEKQWVSDLKVCPRKFLSGPSHIFNPIPQNHDEALAHGNALAKSGNYPVGTSDCFNVGISGGCGPDCFVYLEGRCNEPQEIFERLNEEQKKNYYEIYEKNNY